jgi:hypothetical protein
MHFRKINDFCSFCVLDLKNAYFSILYTELVRILDFLGRLVLDTVVFPKNLQKNWKKQS